MGWVYFAEDEGSVAIKIGYTRSPSVRLKALNLAKAPHRSICKGKISYIGLFRGTTADETHLHHLFSSTRVDGFKDWFARTETVLWWTRFLQVLPSEDIACH